MCQKFLKGSGGFFSVVSRNESPGSAVDTYDCILVSKDRDQKVIELINRPVVSTAEPVGDFVGVDPLFGEEVSFEIRSRGQQRTLCRKKDHSSTVLLFVNLGLLDQLPTLHANVTLKRVVRTTTIVVNEYRKIIVVL